jgi:hypothetical protein
MTIRRRTRTWAGMLAACAAVAALLVSFPATVGPTEEAEAAVGSDFSAGMIITDALFYDSNAMTAAQVQTFLNQRVPNCASGGRCLKDYRQNTDNRPADQYCNGYTGRSSETAAQIIDRVARSCGISQRVLLVLLEKEQSLVSSTNPGSWAYTAATGQGCPDTAPCNSATAGFFYQVYYAARQYEIYRLNPTWWGYQAGRWNNILYHPDGSRGCGTARVFVENQATAALYIYTPYTPNAAALRNLYGTGDTCSSYGNRNFWRLYTDWFGSTRGVRDGLVVSSGDVFVVSGTSRYGIPPSMLADYQAVFGAPRTVSAQQLATWQLRGVAGPTIRNASTGQVAYLQGGQSHYFGTCALVAAWGTPCNTTEVTLTDADYRRIPVGDRMTWFARTSSGGQIHQIEGTTLVPVYDQGTAAALNRGVAPYAAVMRASDARRYTTDTRTRFAPGEFVRTSSSTRVLLPAQDGQVHYLSFWGIAAELGLPSATYRTVPDSAIAGYQPAGTIGLVVRCGDTLAFAARGVLHPVTAQAVATMPVTELDSSVCATLNIASTAPLNRVFLQGVGRSPVYLVEDGRLRHVTSPSLLTELGGGVRPTTLRLAGAVLDRLPQGENYSAPATAPAPATPAPAFAGQLVRTANSSRTYLATSDGRALYLSNWDVAQEWGFPARQTRTISPQQMASLRAEGSVEMFARCANQTYYASRGSLQPVVASAADGFGVSVIDAGTCATLPRASGTSVSRVFVQGIGQSAVYVADRGVYRHVTSPTALAALGGGTRPAVFPVTVGTVSRLPKGEVWR